MNNLQAATLSGVPTGFAPLRNPMRNATLAQLEKIDWGTLHLREAGAGIDHQFGTGNADEPNATVKIHDSATWSMLALGGDIGAGQAWAEGLWDTSDLTATLRILLRARTSGNPLPAWARNITRPLLTRVHRNRPNNKAQAQKNISAHYDLGNDFFSLWLDSSMFYSSGVFLDPSSTLEEAQFEKADRICRKLNLQPGQEVLEIGTGWGSFALHAARHYGARVTTTTISREQFEFAQKAVANAGLQDQITLLLRDYRELEGQYDAVVSIEMIEAVGHQYLDTYFAKINELLKDDGQAVLQSITCPDHSYKDYLRDTDFIRHFIFPGGSLPSLTAMHESVSRHTDLRLFHLEDIGPHYARTLKLWHERFAAASTQLPKANQDPWFKRLWSFYLSSCEALFDERLCGCTQLHLVKPMARPISLPSQL